MTRRNDRLLKTALSLNLALSLGCGAATTLFSATIASHIGGFPAWVFTALGLGLIGFAGFIAFTLYRIRIWQVLLISGLDILWVLATLPLTLLPDLLAPAGVTWVIGLAAAVGTLGCLQLRGLRNLLTFDMRNQYRLCIRIHSDADPAALWRVIRDLGAISRYAPGLASSRLIGGAQLGPGDERICTDTAGRCWTEELISLDDKARALVLRFQSEAEDFPFPFAALTGGWAVTPAAAGGSLVDIWWNVTPRQSHLGWLLVALMAVTLERSVPPIVAAMEAKANGLPAPAATQALRSTLAYC